MNPLLFLNGYKQIAGLVIFGLGCALDLAGVDWAGSLRDFGGVLAGIGAAHKAAKGTP